MEAIMKTFPSTPTSAAEVRAFVRRYIIDADAYLLASEAAQNAIVHGTGATFTVTIAATDEEVRVTVTNAGTAHLPPVIDTTFGDLDAESGRGLSLLALLAPAYGISSEGGHTSTWFAFPHATIRLPRVA